MTHQEFIKRYTFDIQSDRIGTGGCSTVYKAYDNVLDKDVVIKLAKGHNKEIDDKYRLKREMDLVASLPKHPNIASYEDSNTFISFDGEYDFMVMQYYPLGNLNNFIRNKQLSLNRITKFLIQILEGLKFLHEQNIVHLDLNPSNILISDRNGEYIPKITDFGISQKLTGGMIEDKEFTGGTRGFSSPELFSPNTKLTANADLWSYGVIAYWMFTKQMPIFNNQSSMNQIFEDKQMVFDINIPDVFKDLIRLCLVANPEDRIKTAEDCLLILSNSNKISDETIIDSDIIIIHDTDILYELPPTFITFEKKIPVFNHNDYSNPNILEKINYCGSCRSMSFDTVIKKEDWDYGYVNTVICNDCHEENQIWDQERTFSHLCNNCGVSFCGKVKFCFNCGIPDYLMFNAMYFNPSYKFKQDDFAQKYHEIRGESEFYSKNPSFPLIVPLYFMTSLIQESNFYKNFPMMAGSPFYNNSASLSTFGSSNFVLQLDPTQNYKPSLIKIDDRYVKVSDTRLGIVVLCEMDTSLIGWHESAVFVLNEKKYLPILYHRMVYNIEVTGGSRKEAREVLAFVNNQEYIFFTWDVKTNDKHIIKVVDLTKKHIVYNHLNFEQSDIGGNILREISLFKDANELTFIGNPSDDRFNEELNHILCEVHQEGNHIYFNHLKVNIINQ